MKRFVEGFTFADPKTGDILVEVKPYWYEEDEPEDGDILPNGRVWVDSRMNVPFAPPLSEY